jgi:prepilin-type N-terminal cleavage/methylation domain-containing protein/prepilin-type processing-associated H-X9-DG protein
MKRYAFTLIELLVVIAILALIAGLMLPTISRVKARATTTYCLQNHRQLALAWTQYADDNGDGLVCTVDDGDGIKEFTNWVSGYLPITGDSTNSALLVNPAKSLLAQYVQTPRAYKCPSDRSLFCRSVAMNNRLNPTRILKPPLVIGGIGTNWMVYRKRSDIFHSSSVYLIIDERDDSINEGNFAVDLSNTGTFDGDGVSTPYWWLDTPASYHSRAANLSFTDGHAETHPWQEQSTIGPKGLTGFRHTTSEDRDILWLQTRTAEIRK